MKRILFVDDDQYVLDGLRDLLRKYRREWDMAFVSSGTAALEELARRRFDVVVSDMRMPGMDGPTLLAEVKWRHPATARIVLSGQADQELVFAALPVAHQYMSKPCDSATLHAVITGACEMRDVLEDDALRSLVSDLNALPSVPANYWDLTRALADPQLGVAEVGRIVARDPSLSAKILQLVNSAFFGPRQRIASVDKAVGFLGIDLIKSLAMSMQVFAAGEHAVYVPGFSLVEIQMHALQVATLARRIVRDPKRASEAFVAGMLHDVGQIILALVAPERFASVLARASVDRLPLQLVEREEFGVTHAQVGAYLLGTWGLPLAVVDAVLRHHDLPAAGSADFDVVVAVHVSDALVEGARTSASSLPAASIDEAGLAALDLSGELAGWCSVADEILRIS
ncbi:MAG: response regulator [Gemmatimonadota bacterium]